MVIHMRPSHVYENLNEPAHFCGLCQNESVDSKGFHRGLELFNLADFYDAHEVWEDVWRAAPRAEKKFLQGLIQIAVGLHHHSTGNCVGAKSLLARGAHNLSAYSDNFAGIDLRTLLQAIADCRQALAEGHPLTRLPRIEMREC